MVAAHAPAPAPAHAPAHAPAPHAPAHTQIWLPTYVLLPWSGVECNANALPCLACAGVWVQVQQRAGVDIIVNSHAGQGAVGGAGGSPFVLAGDAVARGVEIVSYEALHQMGERRRNNSASRGVAAEGKARHAAAREEARRVAASCWPQFFPSP